MAHGSQRRDPLPVCGESGVVTSVGPVEVGHQDSSARTPELRRRTWLDDSLGIYWTQMGADAQYPSAPVQILRYQMLRKTTAAFCPPKPKALDMAASMLTSRAWLGITSRSHSGSGDW
jgi:hypothetical protein